MEMETENPDLRKRRSRREYGVIGMKPECR
jgi:hypothetical protein